MNDPPDPGTVSDHLDAALEASCDTLVVLQSIRALGADDVGGGEGQLTRAIKSLRRAIAELRKARREQPAALALGFVMDTPSGGRDPAGAQSKPRRTA